MAKKKDNNKLNLKKETIRDLSSEELMAVQGGLLFAPRPLITMICPTISGEFK